MKNRLKMIDKIDSYDLYQFSPAFFDLFGKCYPEQIELRRVIRFILALKFGYEIFYLTDNNKTVSYCVIQCGEDNRFEFSCKNDILVGPVLVLEGYRGKDIATKLIKKILEMKKGSYQKAYAYIKKENFASIKTFEKVGFEYDSDAVIMPFFRKVMKSNEGGCKHLIMQYEENKE